MCELGWPGILAPQPLGGLGLGASELGVVYQQIGRVAAPKPLLETGATAIIVLGHTNTAYTHELMQAALAGDLVTTVAMPPLTTAEEAAAPSLQCARIDQGLRLDGSAGIAPLATAADGFVVAAQLDDQLALLFVPRTAGGSAFTRETSPMEARTASSRSLRANAPSMRCWQRLPAPAWR